MNYTEFVASKFKPGEDIVPTITPAKAELLHAALLISSESGELVDAVKKHVMYDQELDMVNVIEELGDLMFSMVAVTNVLGIDMEYVIDSNVDKLSKRYSEGYTDQEAKERKDK